MRAPSSTQTPSHAGYRLPAEWERHEACWLAWPSHSDLWEDDLPAAQAEFTALCRAIAQAGERLEILVPTEPARHAANLALDGLNPRFHGIPFGDIWLRDTAPLFLSGARGKRATVRFQFNGWGGKYILPHDAEVSRAIAGVCSLPEFGIPTVLEGGAIEGDGQGTLLTTEQCLLNPNRNPGMSREEIEENLRESLGISRILWLKEGLRNDHTDGHVDTLARFSKPGTVLCMEASLTNDPNQAVLERIQRELSEFRDSLGHYLEVRRIPSPGRILDDEGAIMPASYMNFYIANQAVIVPAYGSPEDERAVQAIGACFPGRKAIGLPARTILKGGGAFHCITQQQPWI